MNFAFYKTILLVCLSFVLLTACTEKEDKIILQSYGVVNSAIKDSEKNSSSIAGESYTVDKWELVKSTDTIPNKLGIEFGISYKRSAPFYYDPIDLVQVIIFPGEGLTNPETGETQKEDIAPITLESGEFDFFMYAFDEEWEVKLGKWVFQLRQDGKVVLEKTFHVVEQ